MPKNAIKYTRALNKQNRKRFVFHGCGSLCVLLMIISLILIITGYLVTKHFVNKERYIVVIDAGSTSSKISVFKYDDYPWREQGYVRQVDRIKIQPGISNYIENPEEAYLKMEPKLKQLIKNNIPEESVESTPLYLAATAGVRLTRILNGTATDKLIEKLREDLSTKTNFTVENKERDIKILTGREEGIYAWITANYLNKQFGTKPISLVKDPKESAGILDLGGASTQITFAIPDKEYDAFSKDFIYKNENIAKMKLYGKNINLYSRSILCLGKNKLRDHVHGSYIYENIFKDNIKKPKNLQPNMQFEDPCLIEGAVQEFEPHDFKNPPCDSSFEANLHDIFEQTQGIVNKFTLKGTGDYDKCRERVKFLLGRSGPGILGCDGEFCNIQGEKQPKPKRDFYAFSGFYYVFDYLEGNEGKDPIVMRKSEFRDKIKDLCKKKDFISPSKKPDMNEEFVQAVDSYCFDGVYVEYLLEKYGFDTDESWEKIKIINKIEDTTVSWALGYAIVTSGFIPFERPNLFIPFNLFVPLICSFGILLLTIIIVFICITLRNKKARENTADFEMDATGAE